MLYEVITEGGGCVATLHPALLPAMVPDGLFRPVYRRRLSALEDSRCAFILYGMVRQPVNLLRGRNYFLLAKDDSEQEKTIYLTSSGNGQGDVSGRITSYNVCYTKLLRIEKRIGTVLVSQTEVKNFMLQKDLVITRTFGVV